MNNELEPKGFSRRFRVFMDSTDKGQRRAAGNIFKFLAMLLVMTLIARGTSAATLAKVVTDSPSRGNIVNSVSGTAVVSARSAIEITVPEGLAIEEVMTGVGQRIEAGNPLARLGASDVHYRYARETIALWRMQLDLEGLERSDAADILPLEAARRNLARAQEDYENTRLQGEADIAEALEALESALNEVAEDADTAALQSALRELRRAQEDYAITAAQAAESIAEARKELDEALRNQPDETDGTAIRNAERDLRRAQEDYDNTLTQNERDISEAQSALNRALDTYFERRLEWETDPTPQTEAAYLAARSSVEQAENALQSARNRADDQRLTAYRRIEDAESALERARNDYERGIRQTSDTIQDDIDRAQAAYDSANSRAEENLLSAGRRVEDAEIAVRSAEDALNISAQNISDAIADEVERAQSDLESARRRATENLLAAARRVEDERASLQRSQADYARGARQLDDTIAQNAIAAAALKLDIEEQSSAVNTLRALKSNNYILYSYYAGVISAAMPEGSVTSSAPLITLRDYAGGFEAHMQIDRVDADNLTVGDECEVTTGRGSMFYTPTVTGTISNISLPDENDMVTLTIRLPGLDWNEGQRVDAQIVLSRANYDHLVPISALRSDNMGYFILVVEQQSTVLGVQNIVIRINVSIVASDNEMASVRGAIHRNSQVIVGSNKAVAPGDLVRMGD